MKKRNTSRIIALLLFFDLFLSACSLDKGSSKTNYNQENDRSASYSSNSYDQMALSDAEKQTDINYYDDAKVKDIITVDGSLTENEKQLYNKQFVIDSGAFNNCLKKIGDYDVAYDYEQYFNISDGTNLDYTPSVKAGTILKNGRVDAGLLYQYVLKNNSEYVKSNDASNYSATNPTVVNQICIIMADEINSFISKYSVDQDLLEEKLQDLKIFLYDGFGYGVYIAGKGIMQINTSNTNDKKTICHETAHFVQAASRREIAEKGYINRLGYCYQTSEKNVNPYNFLWLEEIAAESLGTIDYLKQSKPSIYENWYDALVGLKPASFDGGCNIEATTFQKDINGLYSFFAAQEPAAQSNVQKMLYTINIMKDTSYDKESAIFYKSLGDNNFGQDYYSQMDVYSSYNCSIALTKAQIFYSKLAQKIANKSVTLNEVFSVISSFEKMTNNEASYDSGKTEADRYLIGYCEIQQNFFEVLANQLGVSTESIVLLYNNYFVSANQYNDVSWLSQSENNLFRNQVRVSKTSREVFAQEYEYSKNR